jgi:hypothetical protein
VPFACTAWLDARPERTTVIVGNARRLEWVDPGLGDPGPSNQRASSSLRRAQRIQRGVLTSFTVADLRCEEKPRNSDVVAAKADWSCAGKSPAHCCVM